MRRFWFALLVPAVAAPADAAGWGPNGHAEITYAVATRPEFRLPPDVAKLMALGSMAPDYFDFNNPSAHAQPDDPRVSMEGSGLSRQFKLVPGERSLQETSLNWRPKSERWHDRSF